MTTARDMTPYETYVVLWDELNALWRTGKGETEESDLLRDRMDGPWNEMSVDDRKRFRMRNNP